MRRNLIITSLISVLCTLNAAAQQTDLRALLNQVQMAVQSQEQGSFVKHSTYLKVSPADTQRSAHEQTWAFKKWPADVMLGYQFASLVKGGGVSIVSIYDGQHLYTQSGATMTIADRATSPEYFKSLRNSTGTCPLFSYLNALLQFYNRDTTISKLKLAGIEGYHNQQCYKLLFTDAQGGPGITVEEIVWVSTASALPVGQQVSQAYTTGQAREVKTWEDWIDPISLETFGADYFSKARFTGYSKEENYGQKAAQAAGALLPPGTPAPDFELPLVEGGTLKLSDLKGKIVVLDFWYKACVPCQEQMLALQKLHDHYDKDKIVFVGVNTMDDPVKDQLKLFLSKRNITMPSVYQGKSIERAYHVYISPALFIIDKAGKIACAKEGYDDTLLKDISAAIDSNL